MNPEMNALAVVVGRVLIGGLYTVSGLLRLKIMPVLTGVLAAKKIPFPGPSLIFATSFQIVAGAMLMLGIGVVYVSMGLIAFTITTSLVMINFWSMPKGPERNAGINASLANVAVIGGLLLAAATASG